MLHQQYFPKIRDEYERSVELVLDISEQSKLLQNDETLRRSIRLRNPYVDPMSLLQVDLLRRWRLTGRQDDATLQALMASVNGIAYGMQNTGWKNISLGACSCFVFGSQPVDDSCIDRIYWTFFSDPTENE